MNADSIEIINPINTPFESEYFKLRWEVLRKAWNQPLGSEKDDKENESIHALLLCDQKPAGVCRLQFNDAVTAQIRYMAVAPEFRGKGFGKQIMEHFEQKTKENNRGKIFLQARENALNFYLLLGYRILEKTNLLFGEIQHYSMEKNI